ncbi:CvpA family protein [Flavobacterium sp.]|uniref:CvpA family protein n=1 Tax=Flavobacterium sp. TaxID=239 RepID=UPI00374CCD5E
MSFLDIILAALLVYSLYKGIKNGLFVELASLISLFLGVFIAIKFSYLIKSALEDAVSWQPKYIEVTAFALTFFLAVVGIHLLAKFFTGIADFAYLGWLNKLGGAFFSVLKTILALSIIFNIFQKINVNNLIVKQETLNSSLFYNPIQEVSKFIYPTLEEWYNDFKNKNVDKSAEETKDN